MGISETCQGHKLQASKRRSPFPSFPSSHSSGARNNPSPPRRQLHSWPLSLHHAWPMLRLPQTGLQTDRVSDEVAATAQPML